jgi:LmbE family N-acetylglucosaminyl deacetylase
MVSEKVLVIVAHPDDEIIGCGATIEKLKTNKLIKVLFTCKTHDNRNNFRNVDSYEKRKLIAKKVSKCLGIMMPEFLEKFQGLQIQRKEITEMAKLIYNKIVDFRPNIIFTHCVDDNHHDHRATAEAVFIATRPLKSISFLKQIYSFEIASASEKLFKHKRSFNPSYFVDVTKTYKMKLDILKKFYFNELRPYPNFRSIKSIKNQMQYRGNSVNLNFAEAFEIIRIVN